MYHLAISIAGFLILGIYIWYRKTYSFWSSQGIKGPTPLPFLGNFLDYLLNPINVVDRKNQKLYGNVYGIYELTEPVLMVSDPDLIAKILVTEFSYLPVSHLKDHASALIGSEERDKLKNIRGIFGSCYNKQKDRNSEILRMTIKEFMEKLDQLVAKDKTVDVKHLMDCWIVDLMCRLFLSFDLEAMNHQESGAGEQADTYFDTRIFVKPLLKFLPKFLVNLFQIDIFNRSSTKFFMSRANALVNDRLVKQNIHNDWFQMVLESSLIADKLNPNKKILISEEVTKRLVINTMARGVDNAFISSMCFYYLSRYPDIQEKVYNEFKENFTTIDELTLDSVNKLTYLQAVFQETLRHHSLQRVFRISNGFKLKELGLNLPKGYRVNILLQVIHKDPSFYEDPEVYNPDRFLPENAGSFYPNAYLPFSLGPRQCPGMKFAYFYAKFMISSIVATYKISSDAEPQFYDKEYGLRAKSVKLFLEPRTK